MNARDLEAPELESQQLDNEDVPSDEAELELDDLEDDELDPEDIGEDEDDLVGDDEDDDEEDDEEDAEEDDEEDAVAGGERQDGSEPVSLEEILATKPDPRRSIADDDIMSVVSGGGEVISERLPSRIAPMRERQEFVCKGCFLVKSRSQLADKERQFCRDCV